MTSVVKNYLRWFELHKCKSAMRTAAAPSGRLRVWIRALVPTRFHRTGVCNPVCRLRGQMTRMTNSAAIRKDCIPMLTMGRIPSHGVLRKSQSIVQMVTWISRIQCLTSTYETRLRISKPGASAIAPIADELALLGRWKGTYRDQGKQLQTF